ncbi:MAG: hypothetical protein OXC31_25085 [Spirochaetaceae bacterium]|nr:hypothetical protein [Spirochaetaceae bacterium]
MGPRIHVDAVRVVCDDGMHNAFTDLCAFGGRYYLTFRGCPDGHMIYPTSRIVVLASSDAVSWERVHSFAVPERDVRDPHFLALGERLFVISGAVRVGPGAPAAYDIDQHQGFCAWTGDGRTWNGPRAMGGTSGYYVWRAVSRDGVAYLCGRRKRRTAPGNEADELRLLQATLLTSRDGFAWTEVGVVQAEYGGETAFLFEPEGSLLAIVRNRAASLPARVFRAGAPYRAWTGRDLDRNIGGPLLVRWGRNLLVGGRKHIPPERAVTALYWLVDNRLQEAAELPSAGDNSYPGFVALSPTRGLLSYYSSPVGTDSGPSGTGDRAALRGPPAIHLAELSLDE